MLDLQGFTCVPDSAVVTKSVMKTEKAKQPQNAGAPEVMITPAMLHAGAEAATRVLDESSVSFCELVAREVYRAMETCRDK